MKLIIDINETYFKQLRTELKNSPDYPNLDYCQIIIANGTPHKERPQGAWIPVSEKLPPNYILCLFCTTDGDIFYGYRNSENLWCEKGHSENIPDVVAWQYLPEPYKKGDIEE